MATDLIISDFQSIPDSRGIQIVYRVGHVMSTLGSPTSIDKVHSSPNIRWYGLNPVDLWTLERYAIITAGKRSSQSSRCSPVNMANIMSNVLLNLPTNPSLAGMAQFSLNNVHKRGLKHHHFHHWLGYTESYKFYEHHPKGTVPALDCFRIPGPGPNEIQPASRTDRQSVGKNASATAVLLGSGTPRSTLKNNPPSRERTDYLWTL